MIRILLEEAKWRWKGGGGGGGELIMISEWCIHVYLGFLIFGQIFFLVADMIIFIYKYIYFFC